MLEIGHGELVLHHELDDWKKIDSKTKHFRTGFRNQQRSAGQISEEVLLFHPV